MNHNHRRKRSESRETNPGAPEDAAAASSGEKSPGENTASAQSSSSGGGDSQNSSSGNGKPPAKVAKQSQGSNPSDSKLSSSNNKQEKQKSKRITGYNVFVREQRAVLEASGESIWEVFARENKPDTPNAAKPKNEFQALMKVLSMRWKELPPLTQAAYETKASEIWSKECEDAVQSSLTESGGDSSSSTTSQDQEEGTAVVSDDTPGKRAGIIPLTVGPEGLTKQHASRNSATWSALSGNPQGTNNASSTSAPQVSFRLNGPPQAHQEENRKSDSTDCNDVDPCSVEGQLNQIKEVVSATKQSGDNIRYGILGHLISSFSDTLLEIMNASPESLTQLLLVMNAANQGINGSNTNPRATNQGSSRSLNDGAAQDASSMLARLIQEQSQQSSSNANMQNRVESHQGNTLQMLLEAIQGNDIVTGAGTQQQQLPPALPAQQQPPTNVDHSGLSAQQAAAVILMNQAQNEDEMKQYMNILKLLEERGSAATINNSQQEQHSYPSGPSGTLTNPMGTRGESQNSVSQIPSVSQENQARNLIAPQQELVQQASQSSSDTLQQLLSILQQNNQGQ